MIGAAKAGHLAAGVIGAFVFGIVGLVIGLFLDLCAIPFFLVLGILLLLYGIVKLLQLCSRGCKNTQDPNAEAENRRRAEEVMNQKKKADKEGNTV